VALAPVLCREFRRSHSARAFADAPMARLVLYTNAEVVHHGAEICLLRDLHRRRQS
jgi:hypothetical protein